MRWFFALVVIKIGMWYAMSHAQEPAEVVGVPVDPQRPLVQQLTPAAPQCTGVPVQSPSLPPGIGLCVPESRPAEAPAAAFLPGSGPLDGPTAP